MGLGHWTSKVKIAADDFGFVYEIKNKITGKSYIGSKQFYFKRGETRKESDWRTYTSSSNWLNEDINKTGMDNFLFIIIATAKSKEYLRYLEAKAIIDTGALWSNQYYNQFLGVKINNRKR